MLKGLLLASIAGIVLAGGAAQAQIKVGMAGPITGSNATFGTQMREGAQQAVEDINAHGGVLGQKLELSIGDDACDPRQAVSVANDMASRGVKVVFGHFCSSSSIPASKVYAEEGVLEISPASTNPAYTDSGSWNTFRTCGRDDQQGMVAGEYIAKNLADANVAILNDNSAYGRGLAEQTQKFMEHAGKKPVLTTAYVPGERDYSALVSRLKAANVTVVYIGGYQAEAGLIARQAKEQGLHITEIGGDALVTSEYWQIAGDAGDGTLMTFPADPRKLATAADVVKEFRAKNIDPEGYVLYAYAAVQVWADAAKKAGSADPKKVAAALKADGAWDTVLGKVAFDEHGDVKESNYVFYVWKNGSYAQM